MEAVKKRKFFKALLTAAFAAYCLLLIYLLFLRNRSPGSSYAEHLKHAYNIIPFKSIAEYFEKLANGQIEASLFVMNILGNLLAFFPMGLLLPHFMPNARKISPFFAGVGMIALAELIQYFSTLGRLDIDDLILNSAGLLLGYLIFELISKIVRRMKNL